MFLVFPNDFLALDDGIAADDIRLVMEDLNPREESIFATVTVCCSLVSFSFLAKAVRSPVYNKMKLWKCKKKKKENGSMFLAPQMRHILASLNSVAFAADGIQKEA